MTPAELSQERIATYRIMDDIVDSYMVGSWTLKQLITMLRELSGYSYRLTAHFTQVWGEAELTSAQRKFAIAREIVAARGADLKAPQNKLEVNAEALDSTFQNRKAEIWSSAERETLKAKIAAAKEVCFAMRQEISNLSWEQRTHHYQGQDPALQDESRTSDEA